MTGTGLDDVLPATIPVLRDFLLVVAQMIGVAAEQHIEAYEEALEGAAGLSEYLQDDWCDLVRAFRDLDRDEATESVSRIVPNMLARTGLHINDLKGGACDLIVGTPRLSAQ